MVGSVEPRPEVWENIRAAIGLSGTQAPLVLPRGAAAGCCRRHRPRLSRDSRIDNSNVIRLSAGRGAGAGCDATTAIAAALVAMMRSEFTGRNCFPSGFAPRRGPRWSRSRRRRRRRRHAQYVAVLQKDGGAPAFILTVDGATKNFTVRKVGAAAEPGKSFELWLISDKLPRPRSLGVIGSGDFTARPVLASYDAETIKAATYAVTIEQAGGSPDGKPTSAPVFTGKLIESRAAGRGSCVVAVAKNPTVGAFPSGEAMQGDKKKTPVGSGRFR